MTLDLDRITHPLRLAAGSHQPMHMAGLVAEGLHGKWQTRVYHKGELPGFGMRAGCGDCRER